MRPEDFHAREDEPVRPKLAAFARFVIEQAVTQLSGARILQTRHGRIVTFEPLPVAFSGSFHVSIAGRELVSVAPGLVNGAMPIIEGVYLDGTGLDGEPSAIRIPRLDCASGPGERRRSYVGIRLAFVPGSTNFDPEDPYALQMVHRGDLPAGFSEGGAPDEGGTAFWPVAVLRWSEDGMRIEQVRQISFFDKTHRYVVIEQRGRHFFDVAA